MKPWTWKDKLLWHADTLLRFVLFVGIMVLAIGLTVLLYGHFIHPYITSPR